MNIAGLIMIEIHARDHARYLTPADRRVACAVAALHGGRGAEMLLFGSVIRASSRNAAHRDCSWYAAAATNFD